MEPGRKYNNNKIGKQQCAIIEGIKVLWQVYHDFMRDTQNRKLTYSPTSESTGRTFLIHFSKHRTGQQTRLQLALLPLGPWAPTSPCTPWKPLGPGGPSMPFGPGIRRPFSPRSPRSPSSPSGPWGPSGPSIPRKPEEGQSMITAE